jgi:uncharacterized protein (DUF952 family)
MTGNAIVTPSRVFKIVAATMWAEARLVGVFSGSTDDMRDGYIHLSSAAQVPGTLKRYFTGQGNLLLVAFACSELTPQLRWEPSRGGDVFPHYYGPLPVKAALWEKPLLLGADDIPMVDKDDL